MTEKTMTKDDAVETLKKYHTVLSMSLAEMGVCGMLFGLGGPALEKALGLPEGTLPRALRGPMEMWMQGSKDYLAVLEQAIEGTLVEPVDAFFDNNKVINDE